MYVCVGTHKSARHLEKVPVHIDDCLEFGIGGVDLLKARVFARVVVILSINSPYRSY